MARIRDSDSFIVLRSRESRPHGEGMDRNMQPAKETSTGHVGSGVRWQTSLRGIAKKARENKTHRFGNLYQLLNVEALHAAFHDLKKKAAQLKSKQYRAKLVRRVNIDKGNGKKDRWEYRQSRTKSSNGQQAKS